MPWADSKHCFLSSQIVPAAKVNDRVGPGPQLLNCHYFELRYCGGTLIAYQTADCLVPPATRYGMYRIGDVRKQKIQK